MSDRSDRISKLLSSQQSRTAYIKAKLGVLVPGQIRALRLKSDNPPLPYQRDLAREAEVHQSRVSMFETPGMSNMTLETLAKVAAGLRVGVMVKFVPFSDMLQWENDFHPDFNITRLADDEEFLNPGTAAMPEPLAMASAPSDTWGFDLSAPEKKKPENDISTGIGTSDKDQMGALSQKAS
jgi:hypothetical protein